MADPSNENSPRKSIQDEASRLADTARDRASGVFEEVKLASNQLVDRIREYIEDANVKHVAIKKDGRTLLEIPMTIGVGAGAAALLFNPILSAVGALAALVSDVTLVVERVDDQDGGSESSSSGSSSKSGSSSGSETVSNANKPESSSSSGKSSSDTSDKSDGGDKTVGRS